MRPRTIEPVTPSGLFQKLFFLNSITNDGCIYSSILNIVPFYGCLLGYYRQPEHNWLQN